MVDPETGEVVLASGEAITDKDFKSIKKLKVEQVDVVPFVTDEIQYLSADKEDKYSIAQASSLVDERGNFLNATVSCRRNQQFRFAPVTQIDFKDVAPRQVVGISAALIPFLEHDDANRALMGSNMQRQAVPLLQPDIPVVSTGMEHQAAYDSGQVVTAEEEGEIVSVTGKERSSSALTSASAPIGCANSAARIRAPALISGRWSAKASESCRRRCVGG